MSDTADPNVDNKALRYDIELLLRVYRDLASEFDHHLRKHQLGRLHYHLLLCIGRRPEATVGHYLSAMKLTKQSISRLIRDLLDHGLIEERSGRRDRRERYLLLTAKGTGLEREITEAQSRRFERFYEQAGPEGVESFRRNMHALLDNSNRISSDLRLSPKSDCSSDAVNGSAAGHD